MKLSRNYLDSGSPLYAGLRSTAPIFGTAIVFSFFINLLLFVSPLYMLQIYDRVITSRSETTLIAITTVAAVLILVYAILEVLRSRLLVRAGLIFDAKIANPIFEAIHRGFLKQSGGTSIQCLRDIDTLREFLTGSSLIAFCDIPWTPIFIIGAFILHPYFGCLAIAGCFITLSLTILNELVTAKHLTAAGGASVAANQSAQATFRNFEVLQAMGMLGALRNQWSERHGAVIQLQAQASDRAGGIVASTKFFRMFLQTCILGLGAYLAINREISPGAMIAASIIIGRALAPLEMAVANWKGFVAVRGSYARVRQLMNTVGAPPVLMALPKPKGALEVQDLVASAPSREASPILKSISFQLAAGEILAVVGPSAAGKSTLARVLTGVWRPLSGTVRLDGADLEHWDPEELGQHLGYLPQDVELFAGSIAKNIARFRELGPEAVIQAATIAGSSDLIQRLPDGYNTQIGDGGQALSGGQRQRIGLARALYGNPSFIVLDEPNSNLDAAGEEALLLAIQKLKEQRVTVVIITHKMNILAVVDKILVMQEGTVHLFGPREQVLQRITAPRIVPASPTPAPQGGGGLQTANAGSTI
jgi:ATP-binding cassette subfamily C protein